MKRNDILLLLGSIVFLVIAWVVFSIMHQLVSSTISQTTSESIQPISPSFDVSVINTLKIRQKIAPVFSIQQTNIPGESQPTPTPIPVQEVVPSAIPTISLFAPTPVASQGGSTQ